MTSVSTDMANINRLRELWDNGVPMKTIAAEFGCSPSILANGISALRALGIDLTFRRISRVPIDIPTIEQLWRDGVTTSVIAGRFDRSPGAMRYIICRLRDRGADLPLRPPRRPRRPRVRCSQCHGTMLPGAGLVCGLCLAEAASKGIL